MSIIKDTREISDEIARIENQSKQIKDIRDDITKIMNNLEA